MIEHIVLLRPKVDAQPDDVATLWAGLSRLRDVIPGIREIAHGENISPEGKNLGFTLGFIVTFNDRAALEGYLPHPEHLAVVPLVRAVADEVLVFDIERV